MSNVLNNAVTHWKSSLAGILSVAVVLGTYFTVTPSNVLSQHTVGIITLAVGAARVLLGLIQTDGIQVPGGTQMTQQTTTTIKTPEPPPPATV